MSDHIIERLWSQQPGEWFCLSTKSPWRDHFFPADECDVDRFVREHKDKDVYFCPHGFAEPTRRKVNAMLPALLWADLDFVDPRKLGRLKPTVAIESSPKRYVGLWLCDRRVTEHLNKRLTYTTGADRGGWDLTQVLRVPGSRNFKYHPTPRVKLLWDDGPRYRVADLEERLNDLPEAKIRHGSDLETVSEDWRNIVKRYAFELRGCVQSPVAVGKRSNIIWKIGMRLREKGASPGEVAQVLRASRVWQSKHGDNESALTREVQRLFARS